MVCMMGATRPWIERRTKEQTDLRMFVYASIHLETENDCAASFVYIASVSCCARINREMMRPASDEMSSEFVMASPAVCALAVPRHRHSVFMIIPQLFIASYNTKLSIRFRLTRHLSLSRYAHFTN